jgi:hypothetical protein
VNSVLESSGVTLSDDVHVSISGGVAITDLSSGTLATLDSADQVSYDYVYGSIDDLLSTAGKAHIQNGVDIVVQDETISFAQLEELNALNRTGHITATLEEVPDLSAPNTFHVLSSTTPTQTIENGEVAEVIDAAGSQTFSVEHGAKLVLMGLSGDNNIVFESYTKDQLTVSHSGTTVIFTDADTDVQVAAIMMNGDAGSEQTIIFNGDQSHEHVALTLVGTLSYDGEDIAATGVIA